ncbi:hypothetical protein KFZ58_04450 [Virgibacillus sp. NKC19-16]|uniref:hypothetical protein n=1 Tax=Virgibacillus salidurans TaxID=2831673 RepID=UPI001F2BE769|nr:hypothetical protein [Virgibacillus sp. NKC19-16]UJL47174.1 hypothetical protein KFZ58_04450 [Virgibacillus sp. NKC19-16]
MKLPCKVLSTSALSAIFAASVFATPSFAQEADTEAQIPEAEINNVEQIPEGSSETDIEAPNKAPEHLEIVKTIDEPTGGEIGAVTVANDATVDEVLGALAATDDSDQTHEVIGEDDEVKEGASEVAAGDELTVTAEDGTTASYDLSVEGSSEIDIEAPNKAPEHLEIVKTIDEPTDGEIGAVTVANDATVDEVLGALAATDDSDQTHEVIGEDNEVKEGASEVATGDELTVTAEDGTTASYDITVED